MYGKSVQPADGRAVDGRTSENSSRVQNAAGDIVSLRDVIEMINRLCSERPLPNALANCLSVQSIMRSTAALHSGSSKQTHSEIGFAKENAAGIPMDAAELTIKILTTSRSWFLR